MASDSYILNLVLVAVLVLANAVFAGSEIALISLREGQLRQLEQRGGKRATTLVRLARDSNRFLATIQIGITLAGFLASATAAVSLGEALKPLLGFLGAAAGPVAIGLVTIGLTFVSLVFGELAPKRLAMQYALPWSFAVARPLDLLSQFARPAIWVLGLTTDLVVRLLGGDPKAGREQLTPAELRDLVAGHRGLNAEQRLIITGALDIHGRMLREVLVPRPTVFVIPAEMPADEARFALAASGNSRAPVVRSSRGLDDCAGIINLRTLTADSGPSRTAGELAQPPLVFPDSLRVSDALRKFKAERRQLALVADEAGAISGIVTLEDLLEEIVGEIYDEADRDVMAVRKEEGGAMVMAGTFPIHDLVDIGVRISEMPVGDYATVAGMYLAATGRIPEPGDRVTLGKWTLEILQLQRQAITSVRIKR